MIARIPKEIGMMLCSMLKWLKEEEDDRLHVYRKGTEKTLKYIKNARIQLK